MTASSPEYFKAYRESNKDRIKENKRIWHAKNKRRLAMKRKARYAADPDPSLAQAKKWRLENPERARANRIRWVANNKERVNFLSRKWTKEHPEQRRYIQRSWSKRNPRHLKEWKMRNPRRSKSIQLKHKYGISVEDFDALMAGQGGCCAICKESKKRLGVDHNHSTGAIRGLLCHSCNVAIGLLHENVNALQRASKYLERSLPNVNYAEETAQRRVQVEGISD
jgi:hypothetical protein